MDTSFLERFITSSEGPPWLPKSAAEARKMAYFGQLIYLLIGALGVIIGILITLFSFFGLWYVGISWVFMGILDLVFAMLMNDMLFIKIDTGSFNEASERLLLFGVVGLIFGIIPGVLILIGFMRMREVFQPQYQPYAGEVQGGYQAPPQPPQYQNGNGKRAEYQNGGPRYEKQPDQYQAPPRYQQPQAAQSYTLDESGTTVKKRSDMVKCKNCGQSYPRFMKECPNCQTPRD